MKKSILLLCLIFLLTGCAPAENGLQVAATTLPVYDFTLRLCQGTDVSVTRLVTENVSCLHDYTLQVSQMRAIEAAQVVVLSGAGLEEFLEDALYGAAVCIDASQGVPLIEGLEDGHTAHDGHDHDQDPHIWLSPENAKIMAVNICQGLSAQFPQYSEIFSANLAILSEEFDALQAYGEEKLGGLSCRELITFHNGFSYFAQGFGLTILKAVEEESGSEAAASELIDLISLVENHNLPAIFTEANGSTAAAEIIEAETGVPYFSLDMVMTGDSFFDAMYYNIDTIWEAYS